LEFDAVFNDHRQLRIPGGGVTTPPDKAADDVDG